MVRLSVCTVALIVFAAASSTAMAQQVATVPKETAQVYGLLMTKTAAEIENPQVEVEGDPSKTIALALLEMDGGVLLVPQTDLKEEPMRQATGPNGVPLGLLFSSPNLVPVIDGKAVAREQLHCLNVDDGVGVSKTNCMLLSVRKMPGKEYRLYGYGKAAKPLIDVKFTAVSDAAKQPVALEIKTDEPPQVVITMFGKYQAKFPGAVTE